MADYISLEMSNMNKGISSKCDGSQERLAKNTRTLTSYFGHKNKEASTSSQVNSQDFQPFPLPFPLAQIEEFNELDILRQIPNVAKICVSIPRIARII